jgi:hypothetical protein
MNRRRKRLPSRKELISAVVVEDALDTRLGALPRESDTLQSAPCFMLTYLHLGSRVSQPRRQSRHRLQAGSDWIKPSRSISVDVGLLDAVDMARHGADRQRECVGEW